MNYMPFYSRRLKRREVLDRNLDRFEKWQGYYFQWRFNGKEYLLWIRRLGRTRIPFSF